MKKSGNDLQKWNKDKFRCECLIVKKCKIGYSWNANNCRCEMKKLVTLIDSEECDVETDEIKSISECKTFPENKTLIKKVENCKPFVGAIILFLCVLVFGGIIIHMFYSYVLPY